MILDTRIKWFCLTLALLALAACSTGQDATPSPTPPSDEVIRGLAPVESVEILILESFPVQVRVVAQGNLPDGCTEIDQITHEREGHTFQVTITTVRPADAVCTEALVPFEETVPLDVLGLEAGTYTVDVNGVSAAFELAVDNVPQEPGDGALIPGTADVDSVEIQILESFPVQINAVARGNLPDGCTTVDQISQERRGNTFTVTITTVRPADKLCTQALVPFEESIPLDVVGLEAGVYTVDVNGVSATFELAVDNVPQERPGAASISGLVWQDDCRLLEDDTPSEGCVADESGNAVGGYRGNGVLDAGEERLGGVLVALRAEACPGGELLATTTTADDGIYTFNRLPPGTYCVTIDPRDDQNVPLLVPGEWTFPEPGVGSATVILEDAENKTKVNFGWDQQSE